LKAFLDFLEWIYKGCCAEAIKILWPIKI